MPHILHDASSVQALLPSYVNIDPVLQASGGGIGLSVLGKYVIDLSGIYQPFRNSTMCSEN